MNSLTFRLLEVFEKVVESGSITAASAALSLSQPTVSLQLKKLSSIIGLPLLRHHQGKILLTDAGEALFKCAQDVLGAQARLKSQIQALHGVEAGSLKLAVVTTAKYIIPPLLGPFCKAHPNIDVRFTVGNREQIVRRLEQNRDDIYFFSQPPDDPSLVTTPFKENHLVVIAPPDYDGPDNCSLQDVASQRFLLREAGSGTRMAVEQFCGKHEITFKSPMIIESNEAIRLAVSTGLGLAIVSEHTLAQHEGENVKKLTITDFPLKTHWQAVTLRHRPNSPAVDAFMQALLSTPSN